MHLVTNFKGEIVDAKLTRGNVHDTKPALELAKNLNGKLYADKGHISKKLTANLKENEPTLNLSDVEINTMVSA